MERYGLSTHVYRVKEVTKPYPLKEIVPEPVVVKHDSGNAILEKVIELIKAEETK